MLAVKRGEEVEEDGMVEDEVDGAGASPALCSGRGQMEGGLMGPLRVSRRAFFKAAISCFSARFSDSVEPSWVRT